MRCVFVQVITIFRFRAHVEIYEMVLSAHLPTSDLPDVYILEPTVGIDEISDEKGMNDVLVLSFCLIFRT